MAKYIYPAVFTKETDGGYSVVFYDLESCYTCGDTLEEAMEMAEDVLALTLYGYEVEHKEIPSPTPIPSISVSANEFVSLIRCDTISYLKKYSNKAVKKTLTIPEWMNDEGMRLGINFSQLLQDALLQKLDIH